MPVNKKNKKAIIIKSTKDKIENFIKLMKKINLITYTKNQKQKEKMEKCVKFMSSKWKSQAAITFLVFDHGCRFHSFWGRWIQKWGQFWPHFRIQRPQKARWCREKNVVFPSWVSFLWLTWSPITKMRSKWKSKMAPRKIFDFPSWVYFSWFLGLLITKMRWN